MRTIIDGRSFEWDENKNKENRRKHHVDFETAARVFFDPERVELPDEAHSNDELQ